MKFLDKVTWMFPVALITGIGVYFGYGPTNDQNEFADLNNEGRPDLVQLINSSPNIRGLYVRLQGNGESGRFSESNRVIKSAPLGPAIESFNLEDINLDGNIDLIYRVDSSRNPRDNREFMRPGNGDGTFGKEESMY